jgi:hypothetical protein
MIDPAKRLDQIAQRQRDKMRAKAAPQDETSVPLVSSPSPDITAIPPLRSAPIGERHCLRRSPPQTVTKAFRRS